MKAVKEVQEVLKISLGTEISHFRSYNIERAQHTGEGGGGGGGH
jgi:hypothetical protein